MIYVDASGNRYETNNPDDPRVMVWPQGGGAHANVPHKQFHAAFTREAQPPAWRAGTVTAEWFATDDGPGKAYPCWSNGEVWNGWGMPAFTKATIDEMLVDSAPDRFTETVTWVDGKLMVYDPQEEETYTIDPITIPGIAEPLYSLGAGSWTWDAVKFKEA